MLQTAQRRLSRLSSLPIVTDEAMLAGFLRCQRLATQGAKEIGGLLREGWTEAQTAKLYDTYLRDHGVSAYFHRPYAWFGERTRFDGIRSYSQFKPSQRHILPGEVFILDSAPILDGFIADIGFTSCLGGNPAFDEAQSFLSSLRRELPRLFETQARGGAIWDAVDAKIKQAGFDAVHRLYPFSVLGHRVHSGVTSRADLGVLHFGWQSFWSLLSRGLFGQLLTPSHEGDLTGVWAIEPHIGAKGFGAKFEEILIVEKGRARWLETSP